MLDLPTIIDQWVKEKKLDFFRSEFGFSGEVWWKIAAKNYDYVMFFNRNNEEFGVRDKPGTVGYWMILDPSNPDFFDRLETQLKCLI